MKNFRILTTGIALLAMAASANAADLQGHEPASRIGLFAGGTIRLSLDGRSERRPCARLSLAGYRMSDRSTGAGVRLVQPRGIEFGAGEAGKPTLFVGGQPMTNLQRRLNLTGSSNTLLWVGGAVALGVAALLVLDDGNDACCLDPNLCEPCDD